VKIRLWTALAGILAIGAGTALTAPAAQAAPVAPAVGAQHCAYDLDTAAYACAATAEQASARVAGRALYVVARLWEHVDFQGRSLTYTKRRPCTPTMLDREISVPVVPNGWNDILSSVRTDLTTPRTRCSVRIYEHGPYQGPTFTIRNYVRNLDTFGWNDLASSWYVS
jgi:hypothetical protein